MSRTAYYECPSNTLTRLECRRLIADLRAVAAEALQVEEKHLPNYQCLSYDDPILSLKDKLIVCVYDEHSDLIAFTSSVLVLIPFLQDPIIHLGLTCIIPSARSSGLTKHLVRTLLTEYARTHDSPIGQDRIWITNLAGVISSLGTVSKTMQQVYPSPMYPQPPSAMHRIIPGAISRSPSLRTAMFISPEASFDASTSVFKGSVRGTIFTNDMGANQRHRDGEVDAFYRRLVDFERGDEVLQVGYVPMVELRLLARMSTKL